jgi:hypothetical protein
VSLTGFEDVREDLEGMEEAELRALVERAARIVELTEHPGWSFFVDYLMALTTGAQRRVLNGRLKTMEEYRYETGRIAGLREAIEAPQQLLNQVSARQRQVEQAE